MLGPMAKGNLVYLCMKNFISTTRNCHSHIHESTHFILFALLKVHHRFSLFGPPKLMGPGWPPSQWAWWLLHFKFYKTNRLWGICYQLDSGHYISKEVLFPPNWTKTFGPVISLKQYKLQQICCHSPDTICQRNSINKKY